MNAILIASTVAVVSMFPPGPHAVFRQNRHIIEFNQLVVTHKVEIFDNDGCKISRDSTVEDQTRIIVQLKACDRTGFPAGIMSIRWTVNGVSDKYELHIRSHH